LSDICARVVEFGAKYFGGARLSIEMVVFRCEIEEKVVRDFGLGTPFRSWVLGFPYTSKRFGDLVVSDVVDQTTQFASNLAQR
jgi:hypothetical protein